MIDYLINDWIYSHYCYYFSYCFVYGIEEAYRSAVSHQFLMPFLENERQHSRPICYEYIDVLASLHLYIMLL